MAEILRKTAVSPFPTGSLEFSVKKAIYKTLNDTCPEKKYLRQSFAVLKIFDSVCSNPVKPYDIGNHPMCIMALGHQLEISI